MRRRSRFKKQTAPFLAPFLAPFPKQGNVLNDGQDDGEWEMVGMEGDEEPGTNFSYSCS